MKVSRSAAGCWPQGLPLLGIIVALMCILVRAGAFFGLPPKQLAVICLLVMNAGGQVLTWDHSFSAGADSSIREPREPRSLSAEVTVGSLLLDTLVALGKALAAAMLPTFHCYKHSDALADWCTYTHVHVKQARKGLEGAWGEGEGL